MDADYRSDDRNTACHVGARLGRWDVIGAVELHAEQRHLYVRGDSFSRKWIRLRANQRCQRGLCKAPCQVEVSANLGGRHPDSPVARIGGDRPQHQGNGKRQFHGRFQRAPSPKQLRSHLEPDTKTPRVVSRLLATWN
jgi:hypothetical protein